MDPSVYVLLNKHFGILIALQDFGLTWQPISILHASVLITIIRKMECLLMFYQLLCLLFFCLSSQPTLSSSSFAPSATPPCSHNEASALMKFKSSFSINKVASWRCEFIGIPSYPKTDSWKEGTDCCAWDGVTCDNITGQVIGLDLSCSWLYGAIPSNSSLFHLPHLQKLNLAHNDFNHSKMSSEFARFTSLTQLNLTESVFAGQIPLQISHLSKLVSLDLSRNDYQTLDERTLGGLFQNLTEVRQLFLDGISMSSVNSNVLMNISSSLSSLSLGGCGLQGKFPKDIFQLPNLKLLNLEGNWELNIYLPKFNHSNHLQLLDLRGTSLSGALPNSIGNLVSLKDLDLSFTSLSGALPNSIGNLVSLEILALSFTNFSRALPNSIGNLVSLKDLDLSFTKLSGVLPKSIGNLVSLKYLDLRSTPLSGALPNSIGNLVSLKHLDLSTTSLFGALPNSIGNLVSLEILSLSFTNISGALPNSIGNLVSLEILALRFTNISGALPNSIGNLVSLKDLDLYETSLSGVLPNSIGNLVSLTDLDLSGTSLSGALPNSINNLRSLMYLSLSRAPLCAAMSLNPSMLDSDSSPQPNSGRSMLGFSLSLPDLVVCTGSPDIPIEFSLENGIDGSDTKVKHKTPTAKFSTVCQTFHKEMPPDSSFVLLPLPGTADYVHKEHEHLPVISINAGCINGAVEVDGVIYSDGGCYVGGDVIRTDSVVGDGVGNSLYNTAQFGDFSYKFSSLESGFYNIDLLFAEIVFTTGPPGIRVFDVFIQQEKVKKPDFMLPI
ncbi:hypothetical protein POUND7_007485 [Theobroma cacao]